MEMKSCLMNDVVTIDGGKKEYLIIGSTEDGQIVVEAVQPDEPCTHSFPVPAERLTLVRR